MPAATITTSEHSTLSIGDGEDQLSRNEADRLLELSAERPGLCVAGHRSLRFAQYVGLVDTGNRVLEILPKIGEETDPGLGRGTLLRLLRMAYGLRLHSPGPVAHGAQTQSLLELFALAYLQSLAELARSGLLRRYQVVEDDLSVVRGKLVLARQIGTHATRVDKIACRFDELSADNPWNQVLKAALHAARPSVRSLKSHRLWLEVAGIFDAISPCADALQLHAQLLLDRQTSRYADAMRWAGWILAILSPNLRKGTRRAPAVLFDMNRLFEQAIAAHLRRRAQTAGLLVRSQASGSFLARRSDSTTERHFHLRPDLLLLDNEQVLAVLDTKWSRVNHDSHGRAIPSEAHAYQLHAYASAYGCEDVVLLYPWHPAVSSTEASTFSLPEVGGRRPKLHAATIDVTQDALPLLGVDRDSALQRLC